MTEDVKLETISVFTEIKPDLKSPKWRLWIASFSPKPPKNSSLIIRSDEEKAANRHIEGSGTKQS